MSRNKTENWQQALETHPAAVKFLFDDPTIRERTSDASFSVMNEAGKTEIIHVHRIFLAIRSSVFDAMFYGPMANKTMPITVDDTTADVFTAMLRYIYTDDVKCMTGTNVLFLLRAAHKYDVKSLFNYCVKYISENLTSDTVLHILGHANLLDAKALTETCYKFIDKNTTEVLCGQQFLTQSANIVCNIVSRDTLAADDMPERCIYKACVAWGRTNASANGKTGSNRLRELMDPFLKCIRFPLFTPADVVEATKVTGSAHRFTKTDRLGRTQGLSQPAGNYFMTGQSSSLTKRPRAMIHCKTCSGQGQVLNENQYSWTVCKVCGGNGRVPSYECKMCL